MPLPKDPHPSAAQAAGAAPKNLYSIGEISERFGLPVSTLRYYDRQGLFPQLERKGGQRRFSQEDIERLRIIECLKASGLEISEIRRYMEALGEGRETILERAELIRSRRQEVQAELTRLEKVLEILDYKCWYYDQLLAGATEKHLASLKEADIPAKARSGWMQVHQELSRS